MSASRVHVSLPGLLRTLLTVSVLAGLTLQMSAAEQDDTAGERKAAKRILIVTGEDYPGHKWKQTTPVLKEQIAKDTRLAVEVTEDLKFLRSPRLHDYDAVVLHFKNYDPEVPGRSGFDNLAKFVDGGGGVVLVHFACGAFQEFKDDFANIAGRAWNPKMRGHDPRGEFQVNIVDANHAITRGMGSFKADDELYTCLDGDTPIKVLAQSQSKVDQKQYAMAFVLDYGQGRVFHCPLGHDVKAFSIPAVGDLFRRGTAWAAGLEPSPGN